MTRVIGLTGGMGSGKSTAARFLAELGAVIIDADKAGHEAYLPHTDAWRKLIKTFGNEILAADSTIDRKKLGTIVFNNPDELKKLDAIIHPQIVKMVKECIDEYRRKGIGVIVLDAPLLFEAKSASLVDEIWVVTADKENVIRRAAVRTGLPEEQIHARIQSQMSDEERIKRSQVIIHNDGTLKDLQIKIKELWDKTKTRGDKNR